MVLIFDFETWALFCLILIISAVAWFLLGHATHEPLPMRQFGLCALNTWSVVLGTSILSRPQWIPLRLFFLSLALYSLNVTTIYTSKLINVFTTPEYEHQIDSFDEILQSSLPIGIHFYAHTLNNSLVRKLSCSYFNIGGRSENHDWFENDDPIYIELGRRYNSTEPFWPSEKSLESVARGEKMLLMDRTYVLSKNAHNIFGLPQNVFISSLQMICERGFPLLRRYSEVISRMVDAGIIEKLYEDFRYNATYLEQIRSYSKDAVEEVIVLRMKHMDGAFAILLVGSAIGVICFLMEIVVDLFKRQKRARRHWGFVRNAMRNKMLVTQGSERKQTKMFSVRYVPEMLKGNLSGNMDNREVIENTSKYEFRYLD